MKKLFFIALLLSSSLCWSQDKVDYYPEYFGDYQTRFFEFAYGHNFGIGSFRNEALAGRGPMYSIHRAMQPFVIPERIIKSKVKIAPMHGGLITVNRLTYKPIDTQNTITQADTGRYGYLGYGGQLRLLVPFSKLTFAEVRAGTYLGWVTAPATASFIYETDAGQEKFIDSPSPNLQFRLLFTTGVSFRWNFVSLGCNLDYARFSIEHSLVAEQTGTVQEFTQKGYILNTRVWVALLLAR